MRSLFVCFLLASLFLLSLCSAVSSQVGNSITFVKPLNEKRLSDKLEEFKEKGLRPVDGEVVIRGSQVLFGLRAKQSDNRQWELEAALTDEEFAAKFREGQANQMRLVCHREYLERRNWKHFAIWHFDEDYKPLESKGKWGTDPQPKSVRLPILWDSNTPVPIRGKAVRQFAEVDAMVAGVVRGNNIPGASLAISYKGKIIHARGFGYSDIESMTSLKPEQPMRIAHLTRPFTSAAIMMLVEQNRLSLDSYVFDVLEIDLPRNSDPKLAEITINQLLHDSAGFDKKKSIDPIGDLHKVSRSVGAEQFPITPKQVIDYMVTLPLSFTPGTQRVESHFGYFLLGQVIEKVSGQSYEQFVKKKILGPLKLNSMSVGKSVLAERPLNEVRYYERSGFHMAQLFGGASQRDWVLQADSINLDMFASSAGLIGTPSDVLKFAIALRGDRARLLSKQAVLATFGVPKYAEIGTGGRPVNAYYGAGWDVSVTNGRNRSSLLGGLAGCGATIVYDGDGIGWVLLATCNVTENGDHVLNAFNGSGLDRAIKAAILKK